MRSERSTEIVVASPLYRARAHVETIYARDMLCNFMTRADVLTQILNPKPKAQEQVTLKLCGSLSSPTCLKPRTQVLPSFIYTYNPNASTLNPKPQAPEISQNSYRYVYRHDRTLKYRDLSKSVRIPPMLTSSPAWLC